MPPIIGLYRQFREKLADPVAIRLHGLDRQEIEERTGDVRDKIVEPKDKKPEGLARIVRDLRDRRPHSFINVNNPYEGSAPRTIDKIKAELSL